MDDEYLADARLEDPHDLARVAGYLETTRSLARRLCANNSSAVGVVSVPPAERTSPASTIATSQKWRWTSTRRSSPFSFLAVDRGEPGANDASVRRGPRVVTDSFHWKERFRLSRVAYDEFREAKKGAICR